MLGWLFKSPRVTAMTRVIHEMCSYSHHMKSLGGELHAVFQAHAMLKSYRSPTPAEVDQVHQFFLSDGQQGFQVMVYEGNDDSSGWVSVSPDGDFRDAHVQATGKGTYIVSVDRYPRQRGRLAVELVNSFVKNHDAANVTIG